MVHVVHFSWEASMTDPSTPNLERPPPLRGGEAQAEVDVELIKDLDTPADHGEDIRGGIPPDPCGPMR
jgi:hypothetical protein